MSWPAWAPRCVIWLYGNSGGSLFLCECLRVELSMDLLLDSSQTMWSLNNRLKGFLEQVNRLQEANRRLEAQIADRSGRSTSHVQDWSQQEQTVKDLRCQVGLERSLLTDRQRHKAKTDNDYARVVFHYHCSGPFLAGRDRGPVCVTKQQQKHSKWLVFMTAAYGDQQILIKAPGKLWSQSVRTY